MTIRLDYTVPQNKNTSIPNPPGYLPPTSAKQLSKTAQPDSDALIKQNRKSTELKLRRAWDLALAPAKSLPMQAIMLYFSGSGIQIFSLGMIFMLLTGPITAVFNIFKAFESLRPTLSTTTTLSGTKKASDLQNAEPSYGPLAMPMIAYIACQGLVLALGLWKCSTMGILPTGSGDWLHFETRLDPPEWSSTRLLSLG
ncbi:uncharacterized protein I303_104460 [Kwoniella dejecticola CBS 10117]|uniref:ER membrane protein complex subunit 4 n=1 Tax=Kwoniella dejecticola CBS 10117 TaxID=1296121 RepID=A0A1A6A588_9TREE|nr:endoplasmic reticulum protein [Kwoniella dejecticola CBS 10117]OBR85229.1 endoplasmic reticulum protein [Kwoniella dejecticola CBS 10117]